MDKLGGRKFVLAISAFIFLVGIFATMLIKNWLTANYCMQFVNYIPAILGIFVGGNAVENVAKNLIKKRGEENEQNK